jgi:hypothetical protein
MSDAFFDLTDIQSKTFKEMLELREEVYRLRAVVAALLAIPDEWAAENRSFAAQRLRSRMAVVVEGEQ